MVQKRKLLEICCFHLMKVFDHDTSFEEDEQEETDGKSDGSGGKHDKKIDDKQVSNEFKKGIMLKL